MNLRGFYSLILIIAFCLSLGAEDISNIKKLTPDFFKDNLKKTNLTERKESIERISPPTKTIEQNNFEQRKYDFYDSLLLFKMIDYDKKGMSKILKKWNSLNASSPSMNAYMVDSHEPNDTFSQATTIIIGDTMESLDIDPVGDVDFFKFDAVAGDTITIGIIASTEGSSLDSYIYLYGTDQYTLLDYNDDYYSLDSRIFYFAIPSSGTYYVKVRDYSDGGGTDYWYSLFVIYDTPPISGTITGRVLDSDLNPVSNMYLDIYDVDNDDYIWPDGGQTDANGYYYFDDVPEGNYKIVTNDYNNGLLNEWFDNKVSFDNADIVTVIGYDTTENIDFILSYGASVSGEFRLQQGGALVSGDFLVEVFDESGNYLRDVYPYMQDNYFINGLSQGGIKLYFYDFYGNYCSEWYDNKTDYDNANTVNVFLGDTTENIDFHLSESGFITGRVLDSDLNPVSNMDLDIYDVNYGDYVWPSGGWTDANGYYYFSGLPSGNYKVVTDDYDHGLLNEWYDNEFSLSTADAIMVTEGDTTENIDFILSTGGVITGRVLDSDLNPVSSIWLYIYDVDNGDYIWPNGGWTDSDGYYYFSGLTTGNYKVGTDDYDHGLVNEWYDNKFSLSTADAIMVTEGDTTENIDFILSKGGVITGQIFSETDSQLVSSNFFVIAYDTDGYPVKEAWTDTSTYTIDGLPQGNIRIYIEDDNFNYGSEWYKDKSDFDSADNIAVSIDDTVRGIDFYLSTSGILKGRVVNEDDEPCFAEVIAFDDFGEFVESALTNDSGYYQMSGFFGETYKLLALPTDSNYWEFDTTYSYEWYNNCYFWEDAEGIYVSSGDTVEDIDFVLNSIGVIDGYVMDESFSPVDSAEVLGVTDLTPVYNMLPFYGAVSDSNGYYRMPASASYYKFVAFSDYYNEQWFYLENDYYDARELYLAPGAALRYVNFILVSNGVLADKKQFTGTSQFNAIVSSSVISGDISVMVYSSLASTEGISVSLVDITGREVYSSKFSMNSNSKIITLPTKNSPSGVYFLKVSHNGKEFTSKVSILK